jgi:tRNA threonylcarbamoyladenosine biosynthesis protein TsaB
MVHTGRKPAKSKTDLSEMILLAVDTSGKYGSIALARAQEDANAVDILNGIPLEGGTFSAQLVPQIAALLSKHGLSKSDIGAFAVASGPGSFTGLRVGLAAVKGLAEILGKPIAAVSRLEAVARSGRSRGTLTAVLDAGRNEIYVGEYNVTERAQLIRERLLSREEFLSNPGTATIVTPERSLAEAARVAGFKVEEVPYTTSDAIARLGWERIKQGITISPEDLEANYIRRSDAEIFAKKI